MFFLLLVGVVFGTLFNSLSSFMQMLIDPNEFQVVQDKMFASFNNINTDLLGFAGAVFLLTGIYVWRFTRFLTCCRSAGSTPSTLGLITISL